MKTLKLDVADLRVESWQTGEPEVVAIPTTTVRTNYVTCTC